MRRKNREPGCVPHCFRRAVGQLTKRAEAHKSMTQRPERRQCERHDNDLRRDDPLRLPGNENCERREQDRRQRMAEMAGNQPHRHQCLSTPEGGIDSLQGCVRHSDTPLPYRELANIC